MRLCADSIVLRLGVHVLPALTWGCAISSLTGFLGSARNTQCDGRSIANTLIWHCKGSHVRCMAWCGLGSDGNHLVCWCVQVQKTCEALVSHGFIGLRTFESILRYYDLQATHHLITDLDALKDGAAGKQRGRQSGNKRPRDGVDTADAAALPIPVAIPQQTLTVAKPNMEARGHTGYLTVARKAVQPASAGEADRTQDN